MAAAGEHIRRLVKADVPIPANAQHLHVNAAGSTDGFIIGGGSGGQVGSVAVRHMGAFRPYIHMAEKIVLHKAMVAAHMIHGNTHILIQVIRNHVREIKHPGLVQANQFLIGGNGRRAGGKTQYTVRLAQQLCSDEGSGCLSNLSGGGETTDLHRTHLHTCLQRTYHVLFFILCSA